MYRAEYGSMEMKSIEPWNFRVCAGGVGGDIDVGSIMDGGGSCSPRKRGLFLIPREKSW